MERPNMLKDEYVTTDPPERDTQQERSQLFLRHIDFIQYIAMINAPDDSLQHDIVNDAFITFTTKETPWDLADPKPLLRKIVENISKRYWRQRTRTLPKTLQLIAERLCEEIQNMGLPEMDNQYELEMRALELCLFRLTPVQRRLIQIHYFDGVSLVDYGQREGCNLNTLYSTLTRIRLQLRKCIEKTSQGM